MDIYTCKTCSKKKPCVFVVPTDGGGSIQMSHFGIGESRMAKDEGGKT